MFAAQGTTAQSRGSSGPPRSRPPPDRDPMPVTTPRGPSSLQVAAILGSQQGPSAPTRRHGRSPGSRRSTSRHVPVPIAVRIARRPPGRVYGHRILFCRFRRMQRLSRLHPMGWDAIRLPGRAATPSLPGAPAGHTARQHQQLSAGQITSRASVTGMDRESRSDRPSVREVDPVDRPPTLRHLVRHDANKGRPIT